MWKSEYGEPDPFNKIGPCRIIAVKHNKLSRGFAKDRYIDVMFFEYFDIMRTTNTASTKCSRGWLNDEIYGLESMLKHMLKDKPNGIYEVIGEIYHHGWMSGYEEPEYECQIDIRDYTMHEANFESASHYSDLDADDVDVAGYGKQVHEYMSLNRLMQIYCAAVSTLNYKMERFWNNGDKCMSTNTYKDMSIAEMENYVWMTEMQIDSSDKCNKETRANLERLQTTMKRVIDQHKKLMVADGE